ncbi:hypothetical protein C5E45_20020 [Nocardia nova]|uniref:Uncharacterized protein n=1 Tax=Nocardia nova TaxID=37330 RepID=A0A2S6AMC4_9NOCA|nr:hypothetical protein [Nocardia nova]PPJ36343.1 hypothetical protein C5E45_20020 [Nocardia nova]
MNRPPLLALRPYHLGRPGIALAAMLLVVDPSFGWLIIAFVCAVFEWHTRTKEIDWPPTVRQFLILHRLASDQQVSDAHNAQPRRNPVGDAGPVIRLAPMSFGDILTGAIRTIRRYWPVLYGFTLALVAMALVVFSVLGTVVVKVALRNFGSADGR